MSNYSVAEARERLPELIEAAIAREEVVITRGGEPVARISAAADRPLPPDGLSRLEAIRRRWPAIPGPTSVELLRGMYEEAERERGY